MPRVIMLELSPEEFDSLLGHLEDDLELGDIPYWETDRGKDVQAITKRMQDQARRVTNGQSSTNARSAQEAR